ncbi:hypothetical protein [Kiloniella majae]|uniref:hypothetical protein n=1 Tax=Kiloniella majae TaxID=1938558 RepID=UPI000A2774CB|nr:hypothetical protein [Kiloniella majae]
MKNNKFAVVGFLFILAVVIGNILYFHQKDQVAVYATQSDTTIEVSPAENIPLQAIAFAFAETAEIYVQDGYNLRLKEPQPTNCAKCFSFIFDHYGDPGVVYELTVRINEQGQAEWIEE